MFVVESFLYHCAGERLLAYLYFHRCAESGVLCVYQRHAHALVRRYGMISGCHFPDLLALFQYRISVARNGFVCKFYAYNLACYALRLLFKQRFETNEFRIVELAE